MLVRTTSALAAIFFSCRYVKYICLFGEATKSFCRTSFTIPITSRHDPVSAFADRILPRPELLCGFLADDDRFLGVPVILICEITTAHDRNTHRSEITGSDRTEDDIRSLVRRRIRYAFHTNAH